jgi:hypothetical protein
MLVHERHAVHDIPIAMLVKNGMMCDDLHTRAWLILFRGMVAFMSFDPPGAELLKRPRERYAKSVYVSPAVRTWRSAYPAQLQQ